MTGQAEDYPTGCLLNYVYFESYKKIAIDLSKQKALDADPEAIEQVNFTGILDLDGNTITIVFNIEKTEETILDFSQGTVRVL